MSAARCIQTPVSWLRLERYHLGELRAAERADIDAHLERCPVCRDCLAEIERDAQQEQPALALPPLEALAERDVRAADSSAEREPERRARWWQWGVWAGAAALAAAAIIIVIQLRAGQGGGGAGGGGAGVGLLPGAAPPRIRFKGGSLAISLVRSRDAVVQLQPTSFAPTGGDRFKVELTCGLGGALHVEAVVMQRRADGGQDVAFPLGPARTLRCGNRVPLPGAFGVDGPQPIDVCLVVSSTRSQRVSRSDLRRRGARALPKGRTICARLRPATGS